MKLLNKLFLLGLLTLSLCSFTPDTTPAVDVELSGFWERGDYDSDCGCYQYKRVKNLEQKALGYHFQKSGKLRATICTDMCGCMPQNFDGSWALDKTTLTLTIDKYASTYTLTVVDKNHIKLSRE